MRRFLPGSLPKVVLLIVAVLLVPGAAIAGTTAATGQEPAATPAAGDCPATTAAENEALARRWYEDVLNGRDLDLLDELLAADAVHDAGTFPADQPAAGTKRTLGALLAGFSDLRLRVEDAVAADDLVALRWSATGTHDGEFQGFPATGRQATWSGINLYRIACGKIAQVWSEVDGLGRLDQLGLGAEGGFWAVTVGAEIGDGATPGPIVATPAASGCPATGPAENEALVRRWWDEVWSGGDVAAIGGLLAEGHVHHWATGPDTIGGDEVAARILAWRAMIADLEIRVEEVVASGDRVAARWVGTGTPMSMRAAAGDEPIAWGGLNIFRIECGRIVETWSEMDTLGLFEQLGVSAVATPVP